MYRGFDGHTPHLVPVERLSINPDRPDVLTADDRDAVLVQQQIDQCNDKASYADQLQQLKLKRSKSNIHEHKEAPPTISPPITPALGPQPTPASAVTTAPASPAVEPTHVPSRSLHLPSVPAPLVVTAGTSSAIDIAPRRIKARMVDKESLDRKSSMHLQLDSILQNQVRALLDPNDPSVGRLEMAQWSNDQLDAVISQLRPQHLPELIRQSMLINELQPAKLLTWRNLSAVNQRGQLLLNNLTGYLAPGHLVGIFSGPDGGATPLLNVLGQRDVLGKVDGEVLYNGAPPDATFNKTVGYVVKEDPHLATLTVYETIYFSARLRLPSPTPDSLVRFRCLMMMKLLGLSHVANSIVGNAAIRGISGGEKRRVSFAVEMVVGHSVLLADLPTNGLDSATAFALMRTMRFACRAGTSMLCSIVQPSPELFRLFHRVLLLSKGTTVYFGPPEYVEQHLASVGFIRPQAKTVPQFIEELSSAPEKFFYAKLQRQVSDQTISDATKQRPATLTEFEQLHFGETHTKSLGVLRPKPAPTMDTRRVKAWGLLVDSYEVSEFRELLDEQMVTQLKESRAAEAALQKERAAKGPDGTVNLTETGIMRHWYARYNSSPYQQMQQNLSRLITLFFRDKGMWRDMWVVNTLMSIFLGSLFYDMGTDAQSMNNRAGLLFFFAAYIGFGGLSLAPVVSFHRPTYYAQVSASYFHAFSYFFSFVLLLTPIAVVDVFLLLLPAYGLSGLTGGVFREQFGFALITLIVIALASRSWVLIVLSLAKNEALANVALVMSNILFFLLAGFLIRGDQIEAAYYWLHIIDYFTYAFRSLVINDITPLYNDCVDKTPNCDFHYGSDALERLYGLSEGPKPWIDFARLVGVWAAFTMAAAMAYWLINWNVPDDPEPPNYGAAIVSRHSSVTNNEEQYNAGQAANGKEQMSGIQEETATDIGIAAPGNVEMTAMDGQQNGAKQAAPIPGDGQPPVDGQQPTPGPDGMPVKSASKGGADPLDNPAAIGFHFKKAYIQWKDLCYDVRLPDGSTRRLLNHVFGFAAPGRMCALMGASGAGKSTLLDVLAGLKNQGTISGELLISGRPRDERFTSMVGYVEQFDSLNPLSTVFETVRFSGRLRLPREVTNAELDVKVANVLRLLEIDHLAQALIGFPGGGGVSPDVRKKVTIGVELIMEPSILFLDEPTTGLDSGGAYAVIATVAKLSEHMAVVCTIHQPPVEIVNFFEQIILMKAGGEVVYFGPMRQLVPYMQSQGLGESAAEKNPVDFALEQLKQANELAAGQKAHDEAKKEEGDEKNEKSKASTLHYDTPELTLSQEAAGRLPQAFLESDQSKEVRDILARGICPPDEVLSDEAARQQLVESRASKAWFTTQIAELTRRNFLNTVRNVFGLKVRYGTTIVFAFFVGTIFLRLGFNQQWGAERLSVIFIAVANTLYGSSAFLPEVYMTRTLYFREHSARMYSAGAFFVARYAGDAPFVIAEIFITSVMIYFMTNLHDTRNFGFFFWCLLVVRWMAIALTHTFGTVVASPGFAATTLIAYMNTLFASCGFFLVRPSFPAWWVWYFDINPLRYPLDFLVQREYVDDTFYCADEERILVDASYDTCPALSNRAVVSGGMYILKCPYECGKDFLEHFGVESSDTWQVRNFAIAHCFMIFFFITAYLSLRFINHIKR